MRREAADITAGDPTRRLPVPATNDTLARLARTLNATLDRLQTALERERRFVDEASHELRTPLTILRAEIDSALSRRGDQAHVDAALVSAREETEHLIRIAEGLLVLARAHDGRIPILTEHVRLRTLVDGSVAAHTALAAEHDVRLDVHVADAGVRIDPTRARQALDNLIDNGIRHSPPGGTVRISAVAEDERTTFAVEDDGPGFEPEVLAGPFQAFHRGQQAGYPGSGLGLTIVAAVADAHHGTVTTENRVHGGARVTVVLAVTDVPPLPTPA
jgi:signal transduction histidine kinase